MAALPTNHAALLAQSATTSAEVLAQLRQGRLPPALAARAAVVVRQLEGVGALSDAIGELGGAGLGMSSLERAARGRADLAAGHVVAVDGQIALEQTGIAEHGYRFQCSAPHLVWSDEVFPKPLPGRWRVYALPASGLVVGAEAFRSAPGAPGLPGPDHLQAYGALLAAAQGLEPSDFEQLRRGVLPPKAAARVIQAVRASWTLVAILLLASVVFVALGWIVDLPILFELEGFPIGVTALATPLCWIHAVRLMLRGRSLRRDARAAVRCVRGVGRGHETRSGRTVVYTVEIGGERYRSTEHPLAEEVWYLIVGGHPLRGYVVEGASLLVAVEPGP